MHTTARLALLLAFSGCASVHAPIPDADPDPAHAVDGDLPYVGPIDGHIPAPITPLESCLARGGSLGLVATVNNDDVTEHGDIQTLAVDRDGRIAVAGADGTIKLWTIEDGFLGQINTGMIAYGAELAGTPSTELLFHDGRIVAGDVRGLVTSWSIEGDMQIMGGTDPDFGIVAVAIDEPRARLAHADIRETGHVMLRGLDGSNVVGPLESELHTVRDVAFMSDGTLVMAGAAWGDRAALELRASDDPTVSLGLYDTRVTGELREVAACGDRIAMAGPTMVGVVDGELNTLWSESALEHAPVGVVMTAGGRFVLTAGADGSVRVRNTEDGVELGSVDVADPVVIRTEPTGNAVFVGSRDGIVSVFECSVP